MQLQPTYFFLALFVSVSAALLAGIYPAFRLGRMVVATAIREEYVLPLLKILTTKTVRIILTIGAAAFIASVVVVQPSKQKVSPNAFLESLLVDDGLADGSFALALIPNAVQFPRDLGPHEGYQTEW